MLAKYAWKYHIPENAANDLLRLRLVNELNQGATRKLTLMIAPTGTGKTTALRQWADNSGMKHAYLSLDSLDNDPARFFKHLIASLQHINNNIGDGIFESLQASENTTMDTALRRLSDQMGMILNDYAIILDNLEVIANEAVHGIVALLLEYLPPQAHLILSSEKEPPLALSELRSVGQLKEIHTPHLGFTMDEAKALLNTVMNLQVPYGDVSALVVRTKGKPGLLKYAALCLRHYSTLAEFVSEFEKEEREERVFLSEILLRHLPAEVARQLPLLTTTDAFNEALVMQICNLSRADWLEDCAKNGEFISRIHEGWYELQPFVKEILLMMAESHGGEKAATESQTRAALWLAENGYHHAAIYRAIDAGNHHLAGQILSQYSMNMLQEGELASVVRWLNALPAVLDQTYPMLSICRAWVKIIQQDIEGIETLLEKALAAKGNAPEPAFIVDHVSAIREYLESAG